jgi:succinate dehydrogenase / fumarate reductase flavoprotein subunit
MKIFPAVHYTMGGMWTTYKPGLVHARDAHGEHKPGTRPGRHRVGRGMAYGRPQQHDDQHPGLYAFGEVNFAYHGATRLGANALLSCIFDGLFCGLGVVNYVRDVNARRRRPVRSPSTTASSSRKRTRPAR